MYEVTFDPIAEEKNINLDFLSWLFFLRQKLIATSLQQTLFVYHVRSEMVWWWSNSTQVLEITEKMRTCDETVEKEEGSEKKVMDREKLGENYYERTNFSVMLLGQQKIKFLRECVRNHT